VQTFLAASLSRLICRGIGPEGSLLGAGVFKFRETLLQPLSYVFVTFRPVVPFKFDVPPHFAPNLADGKPAPPEVCSQVEEAFVDFQFKSGRIYQHCDALGRFLLMKLTESRA
jgi:hypothetical protein